MTDVPTRVVSLQQVQRGYVHSEDGESFERVPYNVVRELLDGNFLVVDPQAVEDRGI